ncbi:serine threonine protein kinase : Cyclin-dependent kinase-activating kinase (Fragment) OS=Gemmata sp. Wa1-1 PE=3 SV=1: Pkinase: TPR_2 [Gemmata massiliana]|uniref:Protein kinase domain-containing protein n=1 Tax=Gemmata massiliana TaxID=1210884 RepID=A0A6P2D6X1_9BACT
MPESSPAESIFFGALERPPAERAAFLDETCHGNVELRGRIEQMLAAQPDLGAFLDQPAGTPTVNPNLPQEPAPVRDLSGAVIDGRYRLLELIGEGGMGTVWAADQLHPIKRRVAVKLIRGDQVGSRDVLARFGAERQAIARMDHPHIAKLLDAGTTGEADAHAIGVGCPYFVMELVAGVPLNEYCDAHTLPVVDRLRLFVQVCAAVQHAHQKGIIHRDLKPSNILVEHHDGKPVPRVIDFGLAKATGGARLPDETLFTRPGNVTGTPLYMAPEQADFNTADIDTRADVYALGVNLYELLTGTTPIEREWLKRAPLHEFLRLVRDSDPPTPSKRLSSTGVAPDVAAHRRTEPGKLGRFLRGDLDWVVMKALAKERDRRYETAAAFAEDIERFLNHEPVLAGPPGTAYRVRKFVRRNRVQVAAAGLVLLALLGGIAGTTIGLVRAEIRRAEAEQARGHEAEQREAAETARAGESDQRARAERGASRTRTALDSLTRIATGSTLDEDMYNVRNEPFLAEVLPFYQELAAEHGGNEESRARAAGAILRVGVIQYRLGRRPEAETAFRSAVAAYTALVADLPAVPEHRRHLVTSHENLAGMLDRASGADHYRQGFAIREKLAADFPALPWCRQSLAAGHRRMGQMDGSPLGRDEHFRRAVATLEQLVTDFPTAPEYHQDLAGTHNDVGVRLAREKPDAAEYHHRRAIEVQGKLVADFPTVAGYRNKLATYHYWLAALFDGRGDKAKSEEQRRANLTVLGKLATDVPTVAEYRYNLGISRTQLGDVLVDWGRQPAAEQEYRRAAADLKQACALDPGNEYYRFRLALAHDHLGVFAVRRGDGATAELHFREVVAFREQSVAQFPGAHETELARSSCNLGVIVRENGRPGESLVWFEKSLGLATAVRARDPKWTGAPELLGMIHRCRAVAYHRVGKFTEAAKEWDRAFELLPKAGQGLPESEVEMLSQVNSVPRAEVDVAVLSASGDWSAGQLYSFACVSARANDRPPAKRKKEHADRAMELLSRSVKAGFTDADRVGTDPDLALLRDRDDFKKLLADLRKK